MSGASSASCHASILPDATSGWRASGSAKLVTRSNIFDYMDGAGELYLAYSFRDLAAREYVRAHQPKITAEVYRFADVADAYGVWSHERGTGGPTGIGQDCDYGSGLLRFWKGTYFVRIVAERETPAAKAAVIALGRHISSLISSTGKRPSILSLLPGPGLIGSSVRFFHKHTVLNYHYYLADGNILDLSDKTDCVLAQYKLDAAKPRLLIVRYPSARAASAAFAHFNRTYFKDKPAPTGASRTEKVEGGHYTAIARTDRVLKLVFEANSREQCTNLLH